MKRWMSGELLQNAFLDVPAATREQLLSGTCPECWDAMMSEEEY